MPNVWRKITLVIYKNKIDFWNWSKLSWNYVGDSYNELWKRIIELKLKHEAKILENQIGLMLQLQTMEAIYIVRRLMERLRDEKTNLRMVFINLEKLYDRTPKVVVHHILENKHVHKVHTDVIKGM